MQRTAESGTGTVARTGTCARTHVSLGFRGDDASDTTDARLPKPTSSTTLCYAILVLPHSSSSAVWYARLSASVSGESSKSLAASIAALTPAA